MYKFKYLELKNKYLELVGGSSTTTEIIEPISNSKRIIVNIPNFIKFSDRNFFKTVKFSREITSEGKKYLNYEKISNGYYFYIHSANSEKYNLLLAEIKKYYNIYHKSFDITQNTNFNTIPSGDMIFLKERLEEKHIRATESDEIKEVVIDLLGQQNFQNLILSEPIRNTKILFSCDNYHTKVIYGDTNQKQIDTIFDSGNGSYTFIREQCVNELQLTRFAAKINLQQAKRYNSYALEFLGHRYNPITIVYNEFGKEVPISMSISDFIRDFLSAEQINIIKTSTFGQIIVDTFKRSGTEYNNLTKETLTDHQIYKMFKIPVIGGAGGGTTLLQEFVLLPFEIVDIPKGHKKFFTEAYISPDKETYDVLFSQNDMTKLTNSYGINFKHINSRRDDEGFKLPISILQEIPQPSLQRRLSFTENGENIVIKNKEGQIICEEESIDKQNVGLDILHLLAHTNSLEEFKKKMLDLNLYKSQIQYLENLSE